MQAELAIAVLWDERSKTYTPTGYRYWYNTAQWWELLDYRQEVMSKHGDLGGVIRARVYYSPKGDHEVHILSLRFVADMVTGLDHAIGVILDAMAADLTTHASTQE